MYEVNQHEAYIITWADCLSLGKFSLLGKRVTIIFEPEDKKKNIALEVWRNGRIIAENYKLKGK